MRDRSRPTPPTTKDRGRTTRGKAWLTAGTVAAYAAVSITRAMPACAQDIHAVPANGKEQSLTVRRWDIPAGPLDAAISAYKRTTGVDVMLSLPAETIAGFKSPGVSGLYTDDQALRALLVGTGLSSQTDNAGRVSISVRASESVIVQDTSTQLS